MRDCVGNVFNPASSSWGRHVCGEHPGRELTYRTHSEGQGRVRTDEPVGQELVDR